MHAITAGEVARLDLSTAGAQLRVGQGPTRVGFVVSKAVGNSVVRHRVTRRLRHLVRDRLGTLPSGCTLVVRALPPAAAAVSADLGGDLDAALRRLRLSGSDAGGDGVSGACEGRPEGRRDAHA